MLTPKFRPVHYPGTNPLPQQTLHHKRTQADIGTYDERRQLTTMSANNVLLQHASLSGHIEAMRAQERHSPV